MDQATLAIVGGAIWAPGSAPATALAVTGERIAAVGLDADIRELIGPSTRVVEARGGTVLPAFNDAHVHFLSGSRALGELDLNGAQTVPEVERRIAAHSAAHPEGWLTGRGWFYSAFPDGMPTVELLDRLVPDRPAYLESYDAHTGWANSVALAMAGVTEKDVLKEGAMARVTGKIPVRTREQELEALRAGMRLAAAHGIGSVQEAGFGFRQLGLWDALRESGELTLRVRLGFDMHPGLDAAAWSERLDSYEEEDRLRRHDAWISTGILKTFGDGVVESKTAWLSEPYAGEKTDRGEPNWRGDDLAEAVRTASRRRWQVEVHAIGDAAITQALDAFTGCEQSRRHRIEHIEAPSPADLPRFARLGIIASMQPQHVEPNPNLLQAWARNLGPLRAAGGWPWKTLLQSGAALAFGSDWPVVPVDPLFSVQVAVLRQTRDGRPAGGWIPAERLEPAAAIAAWTSGSAYAEHRETEKGALRPGMLADAAVIDRNLAGTPTDELGAAKVAATVVGGRVVYEA